MTAVSFEGAINENRRLIRKALSGAIFVKKWASADEPIEKIYTTAGGLVIPSGYKHVGLVRKSDAAAFARDIDTADVESWGHGEPTRRDINKDVTTLKFVMQESKKAVFELYNQVDLSANVPTADGNIVMDKPTSPTAREYRALVVSKDGGGADTIYFARWLPLVQVTNVEDQTWGEDDEVNYGVTLTAFTDPAVKTAVRELWGGPGLDATAMGF